MKHLIFSLVILAYTLGVVSVEADGKPPPVSPIPRPTPIVADGKGSYGGGTALPMPLGGNSDTSEVHSNSDNSGNNWHLGWSAYLALSSRLKAVEPGSGVLGGNDGRSYEADTYTWVGAGLSSHQIVRDLDQPLAHSARDESLTADDPIYNARFVVEGVGVIEIPDAPVDDYFSVTVLSVMEQESGFNPNAFRITQINGVDYEVRGCLQILLDGATRPLIASMGLTPDDLYDCAVSVQVAKAWYDKTNRGVPWRMWVAKPQYETSGHD